jgi:hypothetical protein
VSTTPTTKPAEESTGTESIDSQERINKAIGLLSQAAELLGFAIAIPKPKNDDDPVLGIIVGTSDYIDQISEAHAKLFGGPEDAKAEKDGTV